MGIAAAITAAAVIGGGASLIGAGIQASAASKAAKQQEQGLQAGINEQQQMFNTTNSQLSPYFTAGAGDYGTLNKFLTGGPGQQQQTLAGLPGYQFELNQGLESTQNSYAARGLGASGAALKGAASYATGLANSNWSSFINPLIQASSVGENAAAGAGYQGTAAGQGIAQSLAGQGQAASAGTVGSANALAGGLGSIGNSAGNALLTNALLSQYGAGGANMYAMGPA
jgi:hypothetical protein